jgi:hypothetical protein
VLVLGTIVHKQQPAFRAQTLHQVIEQDLGLAIDSVQILEHHEQWLHLGFAQQQADFQMDLGAIWGKVSEFYTALWM